MASSTLAKPAEGEGLRPRARRVTSYDVAKAAGVAQSTVSRCFDAGSTIGSETRERVRAVAAELGYVPNALARSLILRRSNIVGVIATRLTNRNNPDVVFAIGEALAAAGRKLLLLAVESNDAVKAVIDEALAFPLDGVIACATLDDADILRFVERGIPLVFFNRHIAGERVDSVCTDHAEAARQLAGELFHAGHRRFLCVGGPENSPVSRERTRAFLQGLADLGVADVPLAVSDYSYDAGARVFLDHAARRGRPEAVFCANDQLAFGVMDSCRFERGWRVPEDVSVVGFDDVMDAGRPVYALTTVRQDLPRMAATAVELLLRRAEVPDVPGAVVPMPAAVIRRGSARLASA